MVMDKVKIIDNVEKSINGNKSAITELYEYTYSNMYLLAYNLCHDEYIAEDILQESYITAFTNLEKLQNKGRFEFWLKGIIINEWRKYVRGDQRFRLAAIDDTIYDTKDADNCVQNKVERNAVKDELWQQVNNLPENQQICVILFYYHNMSIEEIAAMLNIPKGSVKSRLHYAKIKLRKHLSGRDISLNSAVPVSIVGEMSRSNKVMLSKIFLALEKTTEATAAAVTKTAGGGILIKIAIGFVSSITAVSLTGAVITNLSKKPEPTPNAKKSYAISQSTTTATTTSVITTTPTTVITTAATTVTTQTTTTAHMETVNFDYKVVNGGIQLTKYTGNSSNVVIPDTIDGNTVVSIGDEAFQRCGVLQYVEIPSTVKTIGSSTFKDCVNLTGVSLGRVSKIGDAAFLGCSSLKRVNVPGSVKSIGIYAFAYCSSLTKVNIAEGTELINYCAFYNCPNLSKVTLPASLSQLGKDVFVGTNANLTLYVYNSSYAQQYAAENGLNAALIG